jgi:hypothetical protein
MFEEPHRRGQPQSRAALTTKGDGEGWVETNGWFSTRKQQNPMCTFTGLISLLFLFIIVFIYLFWQH